MELLTSEDESSETEAVVTSNQHRGAVVALAAIVALLAVVLVLVGNGERDGSAVERPSTTTTSATAPMGPGPDGTAPGTQDSYYLTGTAEPVFSDDVSGWLLLGSEAGSWRAVELATGAVSVLPPSAGLDGVDPRSVVPLRDGVAFMDRRRGAPRLLPLHDVDPVHGAVAVESVPLAADVTGGTADPFEILGVLSAGVHDRLWVLSLTGYPGQERELQATLVDLDGRAVLGPFPLPAYPLIGSELGVLFNAGGHGYLVAEDGVTDLGQGEVVAASGPFAGRIRCDEAAHCHQQRIDLTDPDGAVRAARIPTDAAAAGSVSMAIGDDGSLAALPSRLGASPFAGGAGRTMSMYVTPVRRPPTRIVVDNARSAPVWLPDGNGLLILTGLGLRHYTMVAGEVQSTTVDALWPEEATGVVYVPATRGAQSTP